MQGDENLPKGQNTPETERGIMSILQVWRFKSQNIEISTGIIKLFTLHFVDD